MRLDAAGDEGGGAAESEGVVEETLVDADAAGAFERGGGEVVELELMEWRGRLERVGWGIGKKERKEWKDVEDLHTSAVVVVVEA